MSSYDLHLSKQKLTYLTTMKQFVHAIATEEESIAKLLRAESSKTTAFLGTDQSFPSNPTTLEIVKYNQGVIRFLDSMIMTQWLMLKKISAMSTIQMFQTERPLSEESDSENNSELDNWEYENFDY
ncbi:hypothetical protein GCM10008018_37060 [Paenibacillus marchantiophytorum]|uniref:Uncharacterized protein n=1 Tax=Paenibacillus marchantiophytorum TaxID=1619310 RepID=A0ABQ1EV38_9BACL|nr:hypothetical protein [Paenibacillus marchantiophytorum]GFZ87462.1 hypothetical protein GCM10008018_37060 [Paenibacillus marchantiophytorum]